MTMSAARDRIVEPVAPVRVLIANDHLGWGDALHGVGRYLLNITTHFDPALVAAHPVILRDEPVLAERFRESGVNLRVLGRSKSDPRALLDLMRIVRRERIEVIHVQAIKADTLGRIVGLCTGIPTIVHGRDRIARRPGYVRATDRLLGPRTRYAFAVSDSVRRHLHLDRKIPLESIRVFYHGVDMDAFRPLDEEQRCAERHRLGLPVDAIAAGTTTRLHPSKGHVHLVRALAKIADRAPTLYLLLANEGEEEPSLREEVDRLGLGARVIFAGSRLSVRSFLSALDIFVIPSLSEGFPNSMLEAMAAGRPVLSTDVDGMGEMLVPEKDALVVPAGDPDALAEQLWRLVSEEDLRNHLAEAAVTFADQLSIRGTVEKLTQIYHEVARGNGRPTGRI